MKADYQAINSYLIQPQRAWTVVPKGTFSHATYELLSRIKEDWDKCLKEGILDNSTSVDLRLRMIEKIQTTIGCAGCYLTKHLEEWKAVLSANPEKAREQGLDHIVINDMFMIENALKAEFGELD